MLGMPRTIRFTRTLLLIALLSSTAYCAVQGPASRPREDLPSDTPRQQEAVATTSGQEYTVDFEGTIDGAMTRGPISYHPYVQGWQANLFARIENAGETDVVNPWITVNGRGDWRTLKSIVEDAIAGCKTDAEKARALWEFQRTHRFHATTWDKESSDAVKALNVYGYTLCGDEGQIIRDLWTAAGFKTRPGHPVGHCVTEAYYDGAFHLLDTDEHVICLQRDNKTIASEAEVVRDHDLMKRVHTYSTSATENSLLDQFSVSLYGYTGERTGEGSIGTKHAMNFTLRPGEAMEWRFGHAGKEYSGAIPLKEGERWTTDGTGTLRQLAGENAYALMRNGKWIYRPPLDKAIWRKGIVAEENIAWDEAKGRIYAAKADKNASVTWQIASPYVLVGGKVRVQRACKEAGDLVDVAVAPDNEWKQTTEELSPDGPPFVNLDGFLSPQKKPTYKYDVMISLRSAPGGEAGITGISFDNDIQTSLLAVPELTCGANRIRYIDENKDGRKVKITHAWMERTAWHPPAAVKEAVSPKDGSTVEGTKLTFQWAAAEPGDADAKIVDYHFQLFDREDLRWPLSPNFDKVISLTPSAGKCDWTVPFTGLLNPDTPYWWRVRAKDSRGVWGPWSKAFALRCAAPAVPVGVKLVMEEGAPKAITWDDGPSTRKAAAWRVYGSQEQGFSASDSEYVVRMGGGFCETLKEFNAHTKAKDMPFVGDVKTPANFIGQVDKRRFDLKAPLFAFYRVVAVDEKGNQSGPSDYVELPRPLIYSAAVATAKVGQEYRYKPAATFSIGHLTSRYGYNAAFWNREKLTWTLESGPKWLAVQDGELVGKPTDAGSFDVVLKVENSEGKTTQQRFKIAVEK